MAETITRQLREPFVEAAGLGITNKGLGLLGTSIPTSTYTGRDFVAGQTGLETGAQTAAAGLGALTGIGAPLPTGVQAGSIEAYTSPGEESGDRAWELPLWDEHQSCTKTDYADLANIGGGREAAMMGEYQATSDLARAQAEAGLLQSGFADATQRRSADLQAQQGLGTYQSQLGGTQRQINQGLLSADQEAARETAFADYTQLGLVAPQLASVIGGFPAATQMQSTPPPSTTQQLLGIGIGAGGLMGAARNFMGG